MVIIKRIQTILSRLGRFFKSHILYANDSPHRIALGVAIGLFVAWLPLQGLLMLTVLGLTTLFRANKFAGLAAVWINNPVSAMLIYYCGYLVGGKILTIFGRKTGPELVRAEELFSGLHSTGSILPGFFQSEFWHQLGTWMLDVGTELCLGCIFVGSLAGCAGYGVTLHLVSSYQKKRNNGSNQSPATT